MNGMRFGAGLLGGLLLGLVVIGSTGVVTFGTFSAVPASMNGQQDHTVVVSSTAATTTSSASTSSSVAANPGVGQVQTSTTSAVVLPVSNGGNTTNSTPSSSGAVFSFLNWGTPSNHASAVDSLTSQPSDVRLLILIPVLVAFLLGAIYYRVSATRRDEE